MGIGRVYLIGAGPGRPDLITLRGRRALEEADLIVCDNLLPRNFLEELGISVADKQLEWLGGDANRMTQDQINEMLARTASEGKIVARLKNGDPFLFGRGYEELLYLTERDIPCEVVPGVTAATAATGLAEAPVTFRDDGRSFAVVTARCSGGAINTKFPKADTLVVFMAVSALREVSNTLLNQGWLPDTPAGLIERGTLAWERRITGPLDTIASLAEKAGVHSPALFLLGDAARHLAEKNGRPTILFTGLDPTNFHRMGSLIHWPALEIAPDEEGAKEIPNVIDALASNHFKWVIFTSKVGVHSFFAALKQRDLDSRTLSGSRIVAAGAGTALALGEHGIHADAVPAEGGSAGILKSMEGERGAVLLVQGSHAPLGLKDALQSRNHNVVRLSLHRVRAHPELGRPIPGHNIIYFVSPSGVKAVHDKYGGKAFAREIWCIGEVTLNAVRQLGFDGKVVDPHE
jgi:uroporphyrinogen III methyltransferase/synthase